MEKLSLIFIIASAQIFQGSMLNMRESIINFKTQKTMVTDDTCLDRNDAEKILGYPAQQLELKTEKKDQSTQYQCIWKATNESINSHLYYMLENFDDAAQAHQVFADIVASNQTSGQSTPNDIGDEAWFHSDGANFCIIIVRKGNKLLRLKVNKLTKETSLDEMKRVAREWK